MPQRVFDRFILMMHFNSVVDISVFLQECGVLAHGREGRAAGASSFGMSGVNAHGLFTGRSVSALTGSPCFSTLVM